MSTPSLSRDHVRTTLWLSVLVFPPDATNENTLDA